MDGNFREVFVFVSGSSPQIITETIQALAEQSPPVYPDELYVITTSIGRQKIWDDLLDGGILKEFVREWSLPKIPLIRESIHVIKDHRGAELDDIRTEEENELTAELITEIIRKQSADPTTRLHCSLAGGRKTMSYYMGSILQMFARPQDRLYHVLVPEELASHPNFYYKPKESIDIDLPSGGIINTDTIEIKLSSLSFIRLRRLMNAESLQKLSFREMVSVGQIELNSAIAQPKLIINLNECKLYVGEYYAKLTATQIMFYAFIAQRKELNCTKATRESCNECTGCYFDPGDYNESCLNAIKANFLKTGRKFWPPTATGEKDNKNGAWEVTKFSVGTVGPSMNRIKDTITKAFENIELSKLLYITTNGNYGDTRYGIKLDKRNITII